MKRPQWKPIPGFEAYEVSDQGQIRRVATGRVLKRQRPSSGAGHMVFVSVGDVKSTLRVARVVGAAFCPDFAEDLYPVFRNGNTNDYRAKNLKWVRRAEVTGVPYSVNPKS